MHPSTSFLASWRRHEARPPSSLPPSLDPRDSFRVRWAPRLAPAPPSIVPVWRSPLRGVTLGGATPTSASAVSRDDTRLWWDVTADGLRACLPAVNGLRLGAPSPGEDVRPRSSPRPLPADVPTPRHFMVTPTCLISRPPARHPSAIGIGPTTETPRLPKRWRCQASLSLSLPGYRTIVPMQ